MEKIIDEKTEKALKEKIDKGVRDVREGLEAGKKVFLEKEEEFAERVRRRPVEWVAGAFIMGLLLGKLLSRKD